MTRLFKYLKKDIIFVILSPLMMILEVLMDLIQPLILADIINKGVLGEGSLDARMSFIINNGLLMLGVLAIGGVFGILSGIFSSIASQKFANDLRIDLFKKIMGLSYEDTDKFHTGSLVTRITNDVTQVRDVIASIIRMFVRVIIQFAGGIFFMLRLNINFSLALIFVLPVEVVILIIFIKKVTPFFKEIQNRIDRVNSVVEENVTGIRVVKAYVKEEKESNRFDEANKSLTNINFKVEKIMALISPLLNILMNISVVSIILISGYQIEKGSMQVGDTIAALTFVGRIVFGLTMLGMMFNMLSRGKASALRIMEIFDTDDKIISGEIKLDKVESIEFKNVVFYYPGQDENYPVLNDISVKINKGDTLAILGSTGSGKSTICLLLTRYYDVVSGEILINGINIKDYDINSIRDKMSFVLQKSELFNGTIFENIKMGSDTATSEDVIEASKDAQAYDFITSKKGEFESIVGEGGASLSGGQKQRVAIARSLVRKPDILIFDDATRALDLKTESKLYKALNDKYANTTKIIVAQRVASIKDAKKILVLDKGKIDSIGSHSELIKSSSIYKDIYDSQLKGGESYE